MQQIKVFLFLILLILGACKSSTKKQAEPAFYHWKTRFHAADLKLLKEYQVDYLYVKLFDIRKRKDGHVKVGELLPDWSQIPQAVNVCPVVFVTNRVLKNLSAAGVDSLANEVSSDIEEMTKGLEFNDLQIDCDWSGRTKINYFHFLESIKMNFPDKILSVTIRLHQVKYREKTGVPPVDRGLLMVYNLSNPTVYTAQNSIFDKDEVMKYIKQQKRYPLDLDVGLPLFFWAIHFEQGKFKGFLSPLNNQHLSKMDFLTKVKDNFYEVHRDTVLKGRYLRLGDQLKVEEIQLEDLHYILKEIMPILPNKKFRLSLFHLDQEIIQNYHSDEIKSLYNVYR